MDTPTESERPEYHRALKALQAAHDVCFKHPERDVRGMSSGPFSGVNEVLGIVSRLETRDRFLTSLVAADERYAAQIRDLP